jgi:hypothetical protein
VVWLKQILNTSPTEDKKGFWEDVSEWYQEAEPPQGFQGTVHHTSTPNFFFGLEILFLPKQPSLINKHHQWQFLAALISWAFPPAIICGMAFNVPVRTNHLYRFTSCVPNIRLNFHA